MRGMDTVCRKLRSPTSDKKYLPHLQVSQTTHGAPSHTLRWALTNYRKIVTQEKQLNVQGTNNEYKQTNNTIMYFCIEKYKKNEPLLYTTQVSLIDIMINEGDQKQTIT